MTSPSPHGPSPIGSSGNAFAIAARPISPLAICAISMVLAGLLAGCTTTKHAAQPDENALRFGPSANTSLALAAMNDEDAAGTFDGSDWEFARRDHELGSAGSPIESSITIAEIRMRENLRTSNGRPRNDSHTTSRSFQRRVGP